MRATLMIPLAVGVVLAGSPTWAQDAPAANGAADEAADGGDLLTSDELETLVGPVALYPDTLLMQILVASTEPLDVVKAQQYLVDNADRDPAETQPEIEATDWDESVQVLATAFPEVVSDMATHIEWTETMGDAMLAQDEDVLAEIQLLRQQAMVSGALTSGEQQSVEVVEDNSVVITPTNPQVVYVPQYQPTDIWGGVGDAVAIGAVAFGTAAVIDAIFDDDDDWDDYWGCRNCGGWNGRPIIRDPDIDIDVDGNVNIGNRVDLGDRERNIDLKNRSGNDLGWKPDADRGEDARDKIAARRDDGGRDLPVRKPDGRSDALRDKLSDRSGAPDISRPNIDRGSVQRPNIDRGNARAPDFKGPTNRPAADKASAVRQTRAAAPAAKNRPAVAKKAAAKKAPQVKKAAGSGKGKALAKKAPARKAKGASKRGKASHAKRGHRR